MPYICFNSASMAVSQKAVDWLFTRGRIHQGQRADCYGVDPGAWGSREVEYLLQGISDARYGEAKSEPQEEAPKKLPMKFRTLLLLSCAMGRPIGVTAEEYHTFQQRFISVMEIQTRLVPRGFMNLFINGRAFVFIDRPDESDDERILHAFNTHGTIVTLTEPE